MGDIAVARDIGDGDRIGGQPVAIRQMRLDDAEQIIRLGNGSGVIVTGAEHLDQTRRARARIDVVGGHRQPTLHLVGVLGGLGHPVGALGVCLEQIGQDRIALGQRVTAVIDRGDKTEGADLQEVRRSMFAIGHIQINRRIGQIQSSLSGASRVTGRCVPSITRGINEVEERLGARLFTRATRVARPTDVGQAYVREVRGNLADLKAAHDLPSSGLVAVQIGHVCRVVCAAPAYLAEKGTPGTPQDLQRHNIISIGDGGSHAEWRFGKDQDQAVRIKQRLSVSNVGAGLALARSEWGLTRVLSYQIGPDLQSGDLQTVLEAFEPASLPVHLVHQEGRCVTAKLRHFIDFTRDRLCGMLVLNP